MESNLQKILALMEIRGFFSTYLSVGEERVVEILNSITTAEELEAFPGVFGKYLTDVSVTILTEKKLEGKPLMGFVKPSVLEQMPEKIFAKTVQSLSRAQVEHLDESKINYILNNFPEENIMKFLTPKQIAGVDEKILNKLIQQNKLQYFSGDVLAKISTKLNFMHKYRINVFSDRPTAGVVGAQIKSLGSKIQYLEPYALENIHHSLYERIAPEYFRLFNREQIRVFEKNFDRLDRNAIKFMGVEGIKQLQDDTLSKMTNEQIAELDETTLNFLLCNGKDRFLAKSFLSYVNPEVLAKLDNESISKLTNEQIGCLNLKQINTLINGNGLDNFPSKLMEGIKPHVFCKLSNDILGALKTEQARWLTKDQIIQLINENKLHYLPEAALKVLGNKVDFSTIDTTKAIEQLNLLESSGKIGLLLMNSSKTIRQEILGGVNGKTLKAIVKTEVEVSEEQSGDAFLDSEIVRDMLEKRKYKDLTPEDVKFSIDDYIKEESFDKLMEFCVRFVGRPGYVEHIKRCLDAGIERCSGSIYGRLDEFRLREIRALLENDKNITMANYAKMENIIKSLTKRTPKTIDGDMSISSCFSSIVRGNRYDIDFREMLAQENLRILDRCVNRYYTAAERNSLDVPLKQTYANALVEYANVLCLKYDIDPTRFERILTEEDELHLTKCERLYYETVKKAYEYSPDLAGAVKSWVTPVMKIALKSAVTSIATRNTGGAVSTAIGVVGGIAIASDVVGELDKKNYFLDPVSYHKKQREERENGFFSFCRSCAHGIRSFFSRPFRSRNDERNGFENDCRTIPMELRSNSYKQKLAAETLDSTRGRLQIVHKKEREVMLSELYKDNSPAALLVKNFINLKQEALEIRLQKKVEKLYREFPELREERGLFGYFNKVKEAIAGVVSGVTSSVLDVATFGVGSNLYRRLVENNEDKAQKIANQQKLKRVQEVVDKLNKTFVADLENVKNEEIDRLAHLNSSDYEILQTLNADQKTELDNLRAQFREFTSSVVEDETVNMLLELGSKGRKFDKQVVKKLNKETHMLSEVEKLNKSTTANVVILIGAAKNQLFDLIQYERNTDHSVIVKNGEAIINTAFKQINSGAISFNDVKDEISSIFVVMKLYEAFAVGSLLNTKYESIREQIPARYVDAMKTMDRNRTTERATYSIS
ncbi:MAG: hypothetical protein LBS34_01815 [Rickettsiales bacterium]|jgi:hypothetical protein|nr:hypothetical protein [Rickettsiales bacterium]